MVPPVQRDRRSQKTQYTQTRAYSSVCGEEAVCAIVALSNRAETILEARIEVGVAGEKESSMTPPEAGRGGCRCWGSDRGHE